jgi:Arc/MetJ-type ribon-helix-helix transcriptional regulator
MHTRRTWATDGLAASTGRGNGIGLPVRPATGRRSRPAAGGGEAARAIRGRSMVTGMASKKVTITLDEDQLGRIRALVEAGTAPSVSGFVQHAVGVALDDVAGWGALLADALRETGGALSGGERAWADEMLGTRKPPNKPAA